MVSQFYPPLGNTFHGSVERLVVKHQTARLTFLWPKNTAILLSKLPTWKICAARMKKHHAVKNAALAIWSSRNLRIGKWQVSPTQRGVNFLGYRIWPTHKLLRKDSVTRAKRKVANFIYHKDEEGLRQFTASWAGHAKWADTHNLFKWMEYRHGISF